MAAGVIDYSNRTLHTYILSNQVAVTDKQVIIYDVVIYMYYKSE
jgi:hypothetical protein